MATERTSAEAFIPLCVPALGGNESAYVQECLDTNWVSSVGPFVNRFESMLAGYVGAQHAVATTSGTAALHVALQVAAVARDDEVLVSTLTFIAPANAVRYLGAWPVFIDAEPGFWQMDPQRVQEFLQHGCRWDGAALRNRQTGRRVRAILPVHVLGHPVDMDPILDLARQYQLVVIEDATESLGGRYKERMVGRLGDIACLSFNGNKIITTGGGGMIVTDREEWAQRARYLTTQAKDDPLEYIHHEIGYNYRLTNVQAALGCAQMERLGEHVSTKRSLAARYQEALRGAPGLTLMSEAPWAFSTFWLYTVLVDEAAYALDSRRLIRLLGEHGVQARPLWQPLHLSPAHAGSQSVGGEHAEALNRRAVSLPSSVGLESAQQRRVLELLAELPAKARAASHQAGTSHE